MNRLRYPWLGLILGLLTSGLSAQTASDASASTNSSEQAVVLPSFQVNDTSDKGYLAANSVSATRINTPIADLPFAISAFTPQFINDIQALELYDVVKYSAGVSSGSSEYGGGNTGFRIRGFQQSPEHDGFYEAARGNLYVDTSDIERVEVVKGPASLLYGQIAPGGTVNYISKQAQATPFITVGAQFGSFDYGRATLDFNQPLLNGKLLIRFNAAFENGYQWLQYSSARTTVLSPTFTWKIAPKLSLRANYQGFQRNESPPVWPRPQIDLGTPASVAGALVGPNYPGPAALLAGKTGVDIAQGYGSDGSDPGFLSYYPGFPYTLNNVSKYDWRHTLFQTIDVELDAELGAHWKSRVNLDVNHSYLAYATSANGRIYMAPPNSLAYANGAWSVSPAWNAMSTAQQLAAGLAFASAIESNYNNSYALQNGTPAPVDMGATPTYIWEKGNSDTVQWEAAGDYTFSWGKLKPIVGAYWDAAGSYAFTAVNTANFQTWDVDQASPTYYINHNYITNPNTLNNISSDSLAFTSDQAAYALINASFLNDSLYFVGGGRYNLSQSQTTNFLAAAGTNPAGRGFRTHYTTPQAALGYKVTKDLMLYASYSTSYQLPSTPYLSTIQVGTNGNLQSVPTKQAVPTVGAGEEVGFKTTFLNDRISSTVSVYDIQQTNVVQSVNQIINGNALAVSVQQTEIESKGVETEITLSPVDNWQIFISLSEDDARNIKEPPGYAYYLGEQPAYSAKTLANLWTRYNFTQSPIKGLWVGGGFNYQGKTVQDTSDNGAFLPAYTLWNALVGYDWLFQKVKMSATINGENLSNVVYTPATQVRGIPRRVVASIQATF